MSSNVFVNGARMSGVCAFIVVYIEYEHKTLLYIGQQHCFFAPTYAVSCA